MKDGDGHRAMDYLLYHGVQNANEEGSRSLDGSPFSYVVQCFLLGNTCRGELMKYFPLRVDMKRSVYYEISVRLKKDTRTLSPLCCWSYGDGKWRVCLFGNSDAQGHVDRDDCRFRCGASFIIPAIIGFLGRDGEDS